MALSATETAARSSASTRTTGGTSRIVDGPQLAFRRDQPGPPRVWVCQTHTSPFSPFSGGKGCLDCSFFSRCAPRVGQQVLTCRAISYAMRTALKSRGENTVASDIHTGPHGPADRQRRRAQRHNSSEGQSLQVVLDAPRRRGPACASAPRQRALALRETTASATEIAARLDVSVERARRLIEEAEQLRDLERYRCERFGRADPRTVRAASRKTRPSTRRGRQAAREPTGSSFVARWPLRQQRAGSRRQVRPGKLAPRSPSRWP